MWPYLSFFAYVVLASDFIALCMAFKEKEILHWQNVLTVISDLLSIIGLFSPLVAMYVGIVSWILCLLIFIDAFKRIKRTDRDKII